MYLCIYVCIDKYTDHAKEKFLSTYRLRLENCRNVHLSSFVFVQVSSAFEQPASMLKLTVNTEVP